MELEENYLDNPAYLELLERLIRALKQECHFGHLYFYREAVLDAYVRQRKYKKALAFEEEISLFVAKNGVLSRSAPLQFLTKMGFMPA